jgi:hypothetical protein
MILSPYLELLQSAHQFQGSSNDCGPYCTAILLNAFRQQEISGAELASRMNKMVWRGIFPKIRRIPSWATFPWGIVDILKEFDLSAQWRVLSSISNLYQSIPNPLITIVVVGELRPLWAHYKILAAHDGLKGWGFINPAYPVGEIQWDRHSDFFNLWRSYEHLIIQVALS